MEWNEYRQLADRTVSDLNDDYEAHAILGMQTEFSELTVAKDNKNAQEEIGDWFWYVALLQNRTGLDDKIAEVVQSAYEQRREAQVSFAQAIYHHGNMVDALKKRMFYRKELDQLELLQDIKMGCLYMFVCCERAKFSVTQIWKDNIEKLQKRFPEKFTQEDALNRDVENELSHIEEDGGNN